MKEQVIRIFSEASITDLAVFIIASAFSFIIVTITLIMIHDYKKNISNDGGKL